ncbi:amidohydrolase family protein [Singulisphaera acidiphila]|uniref:Amidohydrolase, imidazolonepropionase n=1 Tax=Singulisphaera acidiphila (strain ATCC BAA-1392 / DSM 18658 / VKM B-2454 / MOB10) TaxID=886293 RepID=L0DQH0_SINAD|nr:amidohydrolase family protein [Singulisphaera acidiphila]AGA31173.1 amidohydrolase, imidazolonepropionase [Singulisphaera acidiphila DSM 18658]
MRTIHCRLSFLLVLFAMFHEVAHGDEPTLQVFRGATVLTAAGGEIADADLVVRGGQIVAIGKRGEVDVPNGAQIEDVAGKVIIPGLVDTHSHIGIYPKPGIEAHSDGNEMTGPVQSGIRALDAIWPDDPGIRMALAGGVTTANIMPGSGNVIGGQTLYVKLRGGPITAMMVTPGTPEGGLKMANGENPKRAYGSKNQAPGTRMRTAALQREQFLKAEDYRRKWEAYRKTKAEGGEKAKTATEPERDLAMESLVEVLDRKRTVHFHTHRADDIMTVVRLADEFGFEVVVQHGTEAYKVADELAKRKVGVSLTILDSPGGKPEVDGLLEQNAAILEKAGVAIAVNTDDFITESRFLLRTASLAVRGGLSEASALRALTITPATMLHLERKIGSIEPGKDADFLVLSGRPFRVYTQVLQTYIEGKKRYDRNDPAQASYAIGGFALPESTDRPKPAIPIDPPADAKPSAVKSASEIKSDAKLIAIRAGRLHTVGGPAIEDGLVIVEDGKIKYAGKSEGVDVPEGTPVLSAAVVTPGLIDTHTVVGVSGRLNISADQDQDEKSDPNQSDARILDSFNPAEPLLEFALRHGVTLIQAMPGPVDVIGGQAGIFRTHGVTAEAMMVRFPSAIVFNLGEVPKSSYPAKGPGTRMGTAALIRNALNAAVNDRKKRAAAKEGAEPDHNLKHEALGLLLEKKVPAVFAAHRADDLATALRLADEFSLDLVLSQATEGYLLADAIAQAKVPVLVHPTMQRPGTPETFNTTLNNAALLADKGIPVAITSAYEGYVPKTRIPLYEAAVAMANGLGYERALKAVTLDAAKILKVDAEYGSLEPGKVADMVLFDGDPFEYASHVSHVLLGGKLVYDRAAEAKRPLRGMSSDVFVEPACCLAH